MQIRHTHKHIVIILMLIASLLMLTGFSPASDMPFNGDIAFHEISLTIPSSFIRDSTQSSEDVWIFEKGFYSKYIILSRSDYSGNEEEALDSYAQYMKEMGADVQRVTFLQKNAILSRYTRNDQYCQEILFAYEDSFYAVALRRGNETEFQDLLNTVRLGSEEISSGSEEKMPHRRPSTMFGRIMDYFSD